MLRLFQFAWEVGGEWDTGHDWLGVGVGWGGVGSRKLIGKVEKLQETAEKLKNFLFFNVTAHLEETYVELSL